jgi:hypothetical protein
MDEERTMDIYVDFLPNQPKNESTRQNFADMLRRNLERRLDASVERIWDLPQLIVKYTGGEYLKLLTEARDLYVDGYFYSCVATCGIVSERIIKDGEFYAATEESEMVVTGRLDTYSGTDSCNSIGVCIPACAFKKSGAAHIQPGADPVEDRRVSNSGRDEHTQHIQSRMVCSEIRIRPRVGNIRAA